MPLGTTRRLALALIGLTVIAAPVDAAGRDDKPPVVLFGVEIAKATRAQMRAALGARKVKARREDDRYWYDIYDAHGLLDGATELALGYTRAGRLGKVFYKLPSSLDSEQVQRVAAMARAKYGDPDVHEGQPQVGATHFQWLLPNQVKLTIARGWPNTTTFLTFVVYPHISAMFEEMESNGEERLSRHTRKQDDTF